MYNIRNLNAFVRLAENNCDFSIHKQLGIPRSTLWSYISDLERETSLHLIIRKKQNNLLTEEAKAFLPFAIRIVRLFEEGVAQAKLKNDIVPEGEILISTTYSMANSWIMPSIKSFQEFYPKIKLRVIASDFIDTSTEMIADILFRPLQPKDFLIRKWHFSHHLCLLASPDYLASRGVPQTPQDLKKHALIGYGKHIFSYCPEIDWHLKGRWPNFPKLSPLITINSTFSIYKAALEGLGICSNSLEANWFYKEKLIRVLPHITGPIINVYFSTKKIMSPNLEKNVKIFNNFFANYLKNLGINIINEKAAA